MASKKNKHLAVIGGGAAGFFAAINAAEMNPNLSVFIAEKSREVLSKVRISGGGRCNVTHHCFDPEQLSKAYPRGAKELRWAFEHFQPADTVDWFRQRGVKLKTEEDGRMFPVTDDSSTVIDCLLQAAEKNKVSIRTRTRVDAIQPLSDSRFRLKLHNQKDVVCDYVLIATGGFSRQSAYEWLKPIGHSIEPPVPSLFTFNFRNKIFSDLAGISVPNASVAIDNSPYESTGPLLITHWGLSGPAILKSSAFAARYLSEQEYRFDIRVNWLYPLNEEKIRQRLKQLREQNAKKLADKQDIFPLPSRLWHRFLSQASISPAKRWAELSNRDIHELTRQLSNGRYQIQGKTTYKEEFVTCGGVSLDEINFATMQSKKGPGVWLAGEVLDIDGITGGYNFQSAWTTAWIAAQAISQL